MSLKPVTQLRDYQKNAITKIREYFAKPQGEYSFTLKDGEIFTYEARRRVILQMSTGAGKTACFAEMLKKCYEKQTPAFMAVRGAKLVHQASERLRREDVPHGIWQAGNTRGTHHIIQICSIDTLYRRQITPKAGFVVVDECHLTNGAAYEWLTTHENYRDTFFLGVSATPFSVTGLAHIGSDIIYPIHISELMARGYLVGARYYAPYTVNTKGVKKSGGDFNMKSLAKRLDEEQKGVVDSLTSQWLIHGQGKKSIVFAVDRAHAKSLAAELARVGARMGYIDGNTAHGERDQIIKSMEAGELDAIASVGVLTTGVDIPCLECLFIARPTASHNLWIQMLGRGTRPFPGKTHFTVIDLTGNTRKLGPIEAEMIGMVEPTKAKNDTPDLTMCEVCYAVFPPSDRKKSESHFLCPACDSELKEIQRDSEGREIELTKAQIKELEIQEWEKELPELIDFAKRNGYKKGYIYHTIKVRHGEEAAERAWRRVKALKRWPLKARPQPIPDSSQTY